MPQTNNPNKRHAVRGRKSRFTHKQRLARKAARPAAEERVLQCGIPSLDELRAMKVSELRDLCRENDLKQAKLKKNGLIEVLFEARLGMLGKALA